MTKELVSELKYVADWAQYHLDKAQIINAAADELEKLTKERDALKGASRLALDALLPFGGDRLIMVNQAIAALQEAL